MICDSINVLNDENPLAKKLRNRPIHTYLCDVCYARIDENTKVRLATGKFKLYRDPKLDEEW